MTAKRRGPGRNRFRDDALNVPRIVADQADFCECGSVWLWRLGRCLHGAHQMPMQLRVRRGRREEWLDAREVIGGSS
jgi:hypothetical protein